MMNSKFNSHLIENGSYLIRSIFFLISQMLNSGSQYILLIIIFLSFSCNQKQQTGDGSKPFNLEPSGSLAINIDSKTSIHNYFYDSFKIQDKEFLGIINRNTNSIQIYSIDERKLYETIKFDEAGPNGFPKLRAFRFINPDSIFIVNLYAKNLWLVDIEGRIKKKYIAQKNGKSLFNLGTAFYTGVKPLFFKNKLYLQTYSKEVNSSDPSFFAEDNLIEIEIDLKNETWRYIDMHYPPLYGGNVWAGDVSRDMGEDGEIVYSFAADHNINSFNLSSGVFNSFNAKSDFVAQIEPLMANDDEAFTRYFLETPRYTNIIYDKYRKVYYRFVRHAMASINPATGRMNTHDNASFSIMILDSLFNKLGETDIDETIHQINSFFVTKDGLFISNTNPNNPALKEDELSFTLFKLELK